MKSWDKFKKSVSHFFEKLAKESEKNFGNETLDCCELNKKSNAKKN